MSLYLAELISGLLILFVTGIFFLTKHRRLRKRVNRDQVYVTFLTFAVMLTGFLWTVLLSTITSN